LDGDTIVSAAASEARQLPAPIFRRLHCHATTQGPAAQCGTFVGYTREDVRFVGLAARAPSQPDGRTWVRCTRCKTWNTFEAVTE
jgi:hypothetical protein